MKNYRQFVNQKQKWLEGTREGKKYSLPHSPHNLRVKTEKYAY